MATFKIGDPVYLTGGSQRMTVTYIDEDGDCEVTWHDKNGKEQKAIYPSVALTKDDPNHIPPSSFQQT